MVYIIGIIGFFVGLLVGSIISEHRLNNALDRYMDLGKAIHELAQQNIRLLKEREDGSGDWWKNS